MGRLNPAIRAVLWDFGGVLTDSPFEAFRRFERSRGLPEDFDQEFCNRFLVRLSHQ